MAIPMAVGERILSTLAKFERGLCDDCLSKVTRISPRQTVNQRCRGFYGNGQITRNQDTCAECGQCKLVNRLTDDLVRGAATERDPASQDCELPPSWSWESHVQHKLGAFLGDAGWSL